MPSLHDKRNHNFSQLDNEVITEYGLTAYEGWLYVILLMHLNRESQTAFPGMARLAELMQCSKRHVITCIAGLETKGLVQVVRGRKPSGENRVNEYHLLPVTKRVVNLVHYPSEPDSLGVVNDGNHNHTELNHTESIIDTASAENTPPLKRTKAELDLLFNAIALGSLGLAHTELTPAECKQVAALRKGILAADNSITAAELTAMYAEYEATKPQYRLQSPLKIAARVSALRRKGQQAAAQEVALSDLSTDQIRFAELTGRNLNNASDRLAVWRTAPGTIARELGKLGGSNHD